jgi:hypothetical protein
MNDVPLRPSLYLLEEWRLYPSKWSFQSYILDNWFRNHNKDTRWWYAIYMFPPSKIPLHNGPNPCVFHWICPMRRACNGVVTALVPSGLDTVDDKRREEADKRISRNGTMICWCRGFSYSRVPIYELRKRTTFILQYILIGEGKLYGFLLRQQMDWCELWRIMERLLGRIWFLTVGGISARLQ